MQHWNEMSSRWHEHYARGRPSYPADAVRVADITKPSTVLEVGAGTGALVLMWNRPAGRPEPPITAVENLLEPLWPEDIDMPLDLDHRRFAYAREWPRAFEGSAFEPLQVSTFANVCTVGRDDVVAFFGSMGWIGGLPEDEARRLLDEVKSLLVDREYRLPFETEVHWTHLAHGLALQDQASYRWH